MGRLGENDYCYIVIRISHCCVNDNDNDAFSGESCRTPLKRVRLPHYSHTSRMGIFHITDQVKPSVFLRVVGVRKG